MFVVYIEGSKAVFGPFPSDGLAKMWALRNAGKLKHEILRFIEDTSWASDEPQPREAPPPSEDSGR